MKEVHWKLLSLSLTTCLLLLVASWASAQSRGRKSADEEPAGTRAEETDESRHAASQVIVQADRARYRIQVGFARGNENDKIFLYDTWDVVETGDIWFLEDPHVPRCKWKRLPFSKK